VNWLAARIIGVSVWGPALEGWAASQPVLSGNADYVPVESPAPPPAILPPNERRRIGPVARLALAVAAEATAMSGLPPSGLRSVFASGNGDGVVLGNILTDLTRPGDPARLVSPTQFHNSVHNAVAGYWSIATASQQPLTSLACHDFTFAAGLLTAMAEVATQAEPVLLCVYDHPMPAPLDAKRHLVASFGVGLVLVPADGAGGLAGSRFALCPKRRRRMRARPVSQRCAPWPAAIRRRSPCGCSKAWHVALRIGTRWRIWTVAWTLRWRDDGANLWRSFCYGAHWCRSRWRRSR
jgi:hypothetical protein